jgi:hypothetical protein
MSVKWSRALALLLRKENRGLFESLIMEFLSEHLWHNVT